MMGKFFRKSNDESRPKTMEQAVIFKEKEEFKDAHWVLKNASAKQFYEFNLDMDDFPNIEIRNISGLEETGLVFENNTISGTPVTNNMYHLDVQFYHIHDQKHIETKKIQMFVNADPKDLWKNIPSDTNAAFYKSEEDSFKGSFSDKKIVVASKRGRSHAHEGKFREDDFTVYNLPEDWNIVSVSDGAGSAAVAREGSRLATATIGQFFNSQEIVRGIENNINQMYASDSSDIERSDAEQNIKNILSESVLHVHQTLEQTASENALSVSDLHATLIFTLLKKFSFGYVILSFGVGDCPINLINPDFSEVKLLNQMDVGEFGGGTRFITMKEIFNDTMASRFRITCVKDFSYLVLMTDGIYDPKFITENKLEDTESWKTLFEDLAGNNDDRTKADFINDEKIDEELLIWCDFWSRGNHDDRTLAIIY
ncbi:serine/threonine protein phosphatase PrpC [Chryseobacterium bernardetii]|uniref:Protein phosphatase 2C-like protein n=2 Tax=Chryseobacterium TaxID=59732 RepID=A0A543EN17_9FLAO|nr:MULTISPECIES: PP2C family serine/threonine-protein phosphatase [Chryseobacterium]MDR6369330.1 serine/threonine protein phosphatase PrpC [Chryseobacterium vietnamense]MDR6439748.1 serine/threonine protein phosphatase PrpC [Chryseobacterium bernardetii]TQM22929.1 protein phosphatase 2C-like protein [Chryseobacterium aquifrigidense]